MTLPEGEAGTTVQTGESQRRPDMPAGRRAGWARRSGTPWLVLLLSLFLTGAVWRMAAARNEERAHLRFEYETGQAIAAIQERVNLHESLMRGARGHLAGGAFITETEWQRYLENVNARDYAGLHTIGLATRVRAEDRALYLQAMRELGRADYDIHPPGERPLQFPVTYLEPPPGEDVLGFDMWSDAELQAAMRRAGREGRLAISRKVQLPGGDEAGFVMFLPVYAGGGVPPTVDQREARLVAFVFSANTLSRFLEDFIGGESRALLTLRIYDGTRRDAGTLLYDSAQRFDPSPLDHLPRYERSALIHVGGTPWTLAFATSAAFESLYHRRDEWLIWLVGMPASLILFFLARGLALSRAAAVSAADRAQTRMQASQAQFSAAADNAQDAIITADEQGRIIYCNRAAERLYGYPAEELLGKDLFVLGPAEERERSRAAYAAFVQGDATGGVEKLYDVEAVRKDGTRVPVQLTCSAWRTGEGRFVTLVVRDVRMRREAEAALRRMNEELERRVAERTAELQRTLDEYERADQFRRSVMENAVVGLLTLDREGRVTTANKVFCEISGYGEEELHNRHWSMLTSASEGERLMPEARRVVRERHTISNFEIELIRRDGRAVCVMFGANPLIVHGEVVGSVVAVMDITERKCAEAQVRRFNAELEQRVAERTAELKAANEEMESFTYSVSHDLRAPLRHIDGHVQMLLEEYRDRLDEGARSRLDRIASAAVHMGQLIDDLLRFSRVGKSALRKTPVDMNVLVARARQLVAGEPQAAQVEWQVGALPTVACDEHLMEQVWVNLLANALKYSSKCPVARIGVDAGRGDGTWVFRVRDNGVGFDMRYADKLFKVFERLHSGEFSGTGIGLATVQRIVSRHGGRVWAEARPGEGATFYFSLPAD